MPSARPSWGRHNEPAGFAAVPGDGGQGEYAWVFQPALEKIVDKVQYLTPQRIRGTLVTVLLAHVIAHEIGHLLMGTMNHSAAGITTAGWNVASTRLQFAWHPAPSGR